MTTQVQKDQIWQDNHVNRRNRKFKVEEIIGDEALVKSVSGTNRPKFVKIKLSRFTPRYYSLVTDDTTVTTPAVTQAAPAPVPTPAPGLPFGKITSIAAHLPEPGSSSFLRDVQSSMSGVKWQEKVPNVATATEGAFNVVIRKCASRDSYDIKIRVDGVIVDTWVASHMDFQTVIDALQSRLTDMATSLTKLSQ